MSLRTSSRTLLSLLYSTELEHPVLLSQAALRPAFTTLSDEGYRSLVNYLVKQSLIGVEKRNGERFLHATETGMSKCTEAFPALLGSQGRSWSLLIFKRAPKGDKQFRYLRTMLQREGSVFVTRGVYLVLLPQSAQLQTLLSKSYTGHILHAQIDKMLSGFDWNTINQSLQLSDIQETYSGVSSQLQSLLHAQTTQKRLSDSDKKIIYSSIEIFIATLAQDTGFRSSTSLEENAPLAILSQLQKLLQL